MSQQTSSQGSACSGSTGARAEPMHTMAHFLPAAFLCNPYVSFFYSQHIEEVLGQGPHGPPSSHYLPQNPQPPLTPS